jgi:hypothetical protein
VTRARGGASLSTLLNAFINPPRYSNVNTNLTADQKATNMAFG